MGRITETYDGVPIVTTVMVQVGGETDIPVTLMHRCKKARLI